MVNAWQLQSWESYCDVVRLGRKTRLREAQRVVLWSIFELVRSRLGTRGLVTYPDVLSRVASKLRKSKHPPFEFAVVDEALDISVGQLRLLAALGIKGVGVRLCLNSVDFASGRDRRLMTFSKRPFNLRISISPDRRSILHTQFDQSDTDIMLVNDFR